MTEVDYKGTIEENKAGNKELVPESPPDLANEPQMVK
jgi:hypothetical protein